MYNKSTPFLMLICLLWTSNFIVHLSQFAQKIYARGGTTSKKIIYILSIVKQIVIFIDEK